MIDFVVEQWFAILLGGLVVALWTIARDRRKALDRLVDIIDRYDAPGLTPELMRQVILAGVNRDDPEYGDDEQDGPGRAIAKSMERVTKEKR